MIAIVYMNDRMTKMANFSLSLRDFTRKAMLGVEKTVMQDIREKKCVVKFEDVVKFEYWI